MELGITVKLHSYHCFQHHAEMLTIPTPLSYNLSFDIKIFWLIYQLVNYWRAASANVQQPIQFHWSNARTVLSLQWIHRLDRIYSLCFFKETSWQKPSRQLCFYLYSFKRSEETQWTLWTCLLQFVSVSIICSPAERGWHLQPPESSWEDHPTGPVGCIYELGSNT